MKWTGLNELREDFLSFFESKGHMRLQSYPLIPHNDPSLLLINSGMAPMKKFFTGEDEPPRRRVCTCQKCIRTPDLERVGHTARHGTFFEMLGNFSFGDYFKEDAIKWAWEFLTVKLEIPENRLYPSVYEGDKEAFAIWKDQVGIPAERIIPLGKTDNFWEHGSGPCGPCSEIYFDRGMQYGCGNPDCKPGCDCDRFMEIWNNVFSQFNNDGDGNYSELKQKNIDTGMGLERLACVMQGVDNLFEVDTVRRILDSVCEIADVKYGEDLKKDISIRVITDHIRSATFMICDGVTPSNEGRGYVLRRIIRRAARHGRLLGIKGSFLRKLCDIVIAESKEAYPELNEKHEYINKIIDIEETRFDATIDAGLSILSDLIRVVLSSDTKTISGQDVFRLYDTFGFPPDLTEEIASESNLIIDKDKFIELMEAQKKRAREARANISGWSETSKTLISGITKTMFTGYTEYLTKAKVMAILSDDELVDSISEGECTVILDRTPFYGEGGGQVGDIGTIYKDSTLLTVFNTKKSDGVYLHLCTIVDGRISIGDEITAKINNIRRDRIRQNHSCCHLLQAALRTILGTHVQQAGSYVDDNGFRFDFAHYSALTDEEITAVENLVNATIFEGNSVNTIETDVESAKKLGAVALFGEKYGNVVRMVKMGGFSTELCGGTHVDNTAKIGAFKITSECSVASGIRRIEGTTGFGVLQLLTYKQQLINETASVMKLANVNDIVNKAAQLTAEIKELNFELHELKEKIAFTEADSLINNAENIGIFKFISAQKHNMSSDAARALTDCLREKCDNVVAIIATINGDKLNFIASCGRAAVEKGANAGAIVREAAFLTGGKGGGRPDSAMAGGKDISAVSEALNKAKSIISSL